MTDLLFRMGLSNACFALALAMVATVVGVKARRPQLAHMLWLLVFVKLVTPPIVTIPIVTIPAQSETAVAINSPSEVGPLLSGSRQLNIEASPWSRLRSAAWNHARVWLPPVWLLGSVVVFTFSLIRVGSFIRLLAAESDAAPLALQTAAVKMMRRLELDRIPTILTTSANLSPMVWWAGGKVRIVIPKVLLDQMDAQQSQWILAHELAHVRRRDYLVRWLEWLACVLFWWNPVVWWAQRNLRAMEEICCDELVISRLDPRPKYYANSLLSVVEFLARPVFRPPAMASEINSGGFLERRFRMIVSENPKRQDTHWLQVCVLLCAILVLPLGIASAQDYEAVGRRLRAAVAAGELTGEQARTMMGALRRTAQQGERDDGMWQRVAGALHEGGIERLKIRDVMGAMRRVAYEMKAEGEEFELDPRLREYLVSLELTDEQMELVIGLSRRVAAAKSDEDAIWRRVAAALSEAGIERDRIREVMGAMERIIAEARSEGDAFELAPPVGVYLVELGLTDEQIELVVRLSQRLASRPADSDRGRGEDDLRDRIIRALMDNGIAREQVEGVMSTLRPIISEIQSEGDAFELDPVVSESLAEMGLTDEQIDFVVGIARRLASRPAN